MNTTFVVDTTLATMNCGQCGGTYAIQEKYRKQKEYESGFWNCPYCQCSWGYAKGENQRLRDEMTRQKQNSEQLLAQKQSSIEYHRDRSQQLERSLSATKGAKTRLKNRIANGVCPCCTRSFQNLNRHMESKHPEFKVQP